MRILPTTAASSADLGRTTVREKTERERVSHELGRIVEQVVIR
jgi:hypothetical protein